MIIIVQDQDGQNINFRRRCKANSLCIQSTKEKITKTSLRISFNKLSLQRNITPKYANINLKNSSYPAKQTKQTAEKNIH